MDQVRRDPAINASSLRLRAAQARTGRADLVFDPAVEGLEPAFQRYQALYAAGADVEMAGSDFFASVRAYAAPHAVLFDRSLADVRHIRGRERVRRDGFDHLTLHFVRHGVMELECGGARRLLGAGEAALVEMTQPFSSHVRGRIATVSLSRELMRTAGLPVEGVHGRVLEGAAGLRVGSLVAGWSAGGDDRDAVVSSLRRALADVPAPPTRRDAERRARAMEFIERHLDASLTPAELAQANGMSRATLFRAFEPLGGVAAWIQNRRLLRARLLLATTDMSIAEVGQAAGFASASHLASAFRRRWSVTPGGYRLTRHVTAAKGTAAILSDIGVALGSPQD